MTSSQYTTAPNALLDAALECLSHNWSLCPVRIHDKNPHPVLIETGHSKVNDKGVTVQAWKQLQTVRPTPEQVALWFADPRGKALAVITGAISNLVIIDFDGEQGNEVLGRLGLEPHVRTGSGGHHVYYAHPGYPVPTLNAKAKKALGAAYPGVDIRADGGYALIPPSSNSRGPYVALRDLFALETL